MFYNKPKIELELIRNCNFKCSYCGAKSPQEKEKKEMNFFILKFFLKKLKNMNYKDFFILSGGEPLLYSNIIELFKIFNSFNFKKIILITNFSQFNKIKKIIQYQPIFIFSIHLEYLDFYLQNLKKIKKYLNEFNTVQLQFVLNNFKTNDKIILKKLKTITNYIYNENFYTHFQFISYGNNPEKWKFLNFENIDLWQKFFKFKTKPIFYTNIGDTTQKYFETLKYYFQKDFQFETCFNNNFKLLYNFDFVYECTFNKRIFNFKEEPNFNLKKLFNKKINCFCDYCDFQIGSYCDKY